MSGKPARPVASKTAEWLSKPLRLSARAWCGDCPWKVTGPWSHRDAQAHSEDEGHVAHVDDGEPVGNPVESVDNPAGKDRR